MKIINLLILLSLCMYLLASSPEPKKLKYSIIGAGPVGIYLSYLLLKNANIENITLYERKGVTEDGKINDETFTRPQCLRLPFEIANGFDANLKTQYWPREILRNTIFDSKKTDDPEFKEFWPNFGYHHFPRIKVGNFQYEMMDFLLKKYPDKSKFELVDKKVDLAFYNDIVTKSDLVIISTGISDLSKDIRKKSEVIYEEVPKTFSLK